MTTEIKTVTVDTVISTALALMQMERAGGEISKAKKDGATTLGIYFEALAVEYADDIKEPARNKREDFYLPHYDQAVARVEEQIQQQAVKRMEEFGITIEGTNIQGFKLPQSWRQYKSNVKQWIGKGLAKQYGRMSIGKITTGLSDASKLAAATLDDFAASMYNARSALEYINTSADKAQPNQPMATFKAYKHDLARAMAAFVDAVNSAATKHAYAGIDAVRVGRTVQFNDQAVPVLVLKQATVSTPAPVKPAIETPPVEEVKAKRERKPKGEARAAKAAA